MKIILVIIIIISSIGCSSEKLPAGVRADGFKFADSGQQSAFIDLMKEENIPFEINKNGFVIYLLKNEATVFRMLRKIQYGENLNPDIWESAILANTEIRDNYVKAFSENGIRYYIKEDNGVIQIKWSQTDGPKVDVLRQQLDLKYWNDHHKHKTGSRGATGSRRQST